MNLKLKNLKLFGFKCYEDSGEIPFHDLTVIIGENDSGKSTIYDALEYFLNNKPLLEEDYRDGCDSAEIIGDFEVFEEGTELLSYIYDGLITIRKKFIINQALVIEVKSRVYQDDDFNIYKNIRAPALQELLTRLNIGRERTQDSRKDAIRNYLETNTLPMEDRFIEIKWNLISNFLPIFQRYSSSDYGNPTSLIRKTLDIVYRESFYERNEAEEYVLKSDFSDIKNNIEISLNEKLETQLLSHIQQYKPEIESVSGNYDIDFARGLNFSGLTVNDGTGTRKTIEQLGDGSKKKIFLSILEWDSVVNMNSDNERSIIRAYDEPDAHLHYGAQREMFYKIRDLAEDENQNIQSIICTHALTMIDRASARCINHVVSNENNSTIRYLDGWNDTDIRDFLNQIAEVSGLRNSHIFYEKCFLLVEGEGEENALPVMYKTFTEKSLIEDGIVLINLQTNGQWSNALKFLNSNRKDQTILFLDTDTQYESSNARVTRKKLEDIGFDNTFLNQNCFFIGTKEFEDVFTDRQYTDLCNQKFLKDDDSSWIVNDFLSIRGTDKFSESLRILLSSTCKRSIGKPEISLELAKNLSKAEIESVPVIKELFEKIKSTIE